MDAYNAVECVEAVRAAGYAGPVVSYVVFDGLPVGRHYLDAQRSCDAGRGQLAHRSRLSINPRRKG
jgi:hypothetical protein